MAAWLGPWSDPKSPEVQLNAGAAGDWSELVIFPHEWMNIHSNQLNFHLEMRIPWLNSALFSEVFFGLPLVGFLFAFHDDSVIWR